VKKNIKNNLGDIRDLGSIASKLGRPIAIYKNGELYDIIGDSNLGEPIKLEYDSQNGGHWSPHGVKNFKNQELNNCLFEAISYEAKKQNIEAADSLDLKVFAAVDKAQNNTKYKEIFMHYNYLASFKNHDLLLIGGDKPQVEEECNNIIKDVKDILKYGAANLNEQEARNISEAEEKKRRIEAYMRMQIKRSYQDMARKKGITESELIQLCAAGNCGEHAKLVYDKLLESCPSTIKIELRVVQLGEDDNHAYVAIKPSNVSDDSQTIILDAWPSNQINNPHVVDSKNHFTDHAGEYEVCDEGNGKLSSQGDGKSWDEINITQNNYKNKRPEPINTNTVKKIYKENISSTTPTTPTGYDNSSPTLH